MSIFYKEKYSLHHIFPVPVNNLTIIPKYPFLLTGEKVHHWQQEECILNENTYICKLYPDDSQDDCIPNQIMKRPSTNCIYQSLIYPDPFIEQVDATHILVITHGPLDVEEICQNTRIRRLIGPTEIILDDTCKLIINHGTYSSQQDQFKGSSILLPPLSRMTSNSTQLKLSQIKLDEIHELHDAFNKLAPVEIQPFKNHQESYWFWVLIIGAMSIAICILLLYLWIRYRRNTPSISVRFQKDGGSPEESATTSIEVPPRHPF